MQPIDWKSNDLTECGKPKSDLIFTKITVNYLPQCLSAFSLHPATLPVPQLCAQIKIIHKVELLLPQHLLSGLLDELVFLC